VLLAPVGAHMLLSRCPGEGEEGLLYMLYIRCERRTSSRLHSIRAEVLLSCNITM
jgi:hypothetical protein